MPFDVARYIRGRLPELVGVIQRFPLPAAAAVLVTLYHLFDVHAGGGIEGHVWRLRVTSALGVAFLWSLGAALIAEARGLSRAGGLGLGAIGIAVLAFLFFAWQSVDVDWWLLSAAATVGLSIAPYLVSERRNPQVWQFNHHLWIGAVVAGIAVCLFAGGVSIIIETLRFLFGIVIWPPLHEKVWTLAGFLIGPLYWLSVVPRNFDIGVAQGEQEEFTSKSVAALVRFILVPLLLIFGAILHAYGLKVFIDQQLPSNRIGWLVLSYGTVMAVTALAAYPTRESGGRIVRLFWRIWPSMLIFPIVMLAFAIGQRIGQYGLTEPRYLVVLAAVWLATLVVTQGLALERRDLRAMTGMLMVLLALASIGPWGMSGWAARSQISALITRLSDAGVVRDGRLAASRGEVRFASDERERLHGIIDFLDQRGRLDALRPLFAGQPRDPFAGQPRVTRSNSGAIADEMRKRLAIGPRPSRNTDSRSFVSYTTQLPASFAIAGGGRLIGLLNFSATGARKEGRIELGTSEQQVTFDIDGDNVLRLVVSPSKRTLRFDLNALADAAGGAQPAATATATGARRAAVEVRATGEGPAAVLIVQTFNGMRTDAGGVAVTFLSGWLVLAEGG